MKDIFIYYIKIYHIKNTKSLINKLFHCERQEILNDGGTTVT